MIAVAIVFSLLSPRPIEAQAQVINQRFDIPLDVIFLAADGCLTEDVHIFGTLPTRTQTVVDANGGLHVSVHQIAHLNAVGLTTGDTYHAQGPLVSVTYDFDGSAPREIFFHNIIQLIGPGKDGNLNIHELSHAVFNANGVQTVDVNKVDVVCH
jgi:hypothetical protein